MLNKKFLFLSCVTLIVFLTPMLAWLGIANAESTPIAFEKQTTTAVWEKEQEKVTDSVYKNLKDHSRKKINELTDKRTKFSKTFFNNDNTFTVVKSTYALHYNSGGKWVDVSNNIKEISKNLYGNERDDTSIIFQKDSAITTISDNKYTIKYEPIFNQSVVGVVYDNMLDYKNIWNDTTLRYRLQNDSLKMDLLLATDAAPKKFSFNLETKGLTPIKKADGTIVFTNESHEIKYLIPRMWVKDSTSDEIYFDKIIPSIQKVGSSYLLEFSLNDKGLQYPLIIDPTTTIVRSTPTFDGPFTLYIDTDDINIASFTELKVSNNSHYNGGATFNVPADVYVTLQEYGDLWDPVQSDNIAWVAKTTSFDGIQNSATVNKTTLTNILGVNGKFYGVVFYSPYFSSYDNDFTVEITFSSDLSSPSNLQFSIDHHSNVVSLNWNPATDPNTISEYQILANDKVIGTTSSNSIMISGLPNTKTPYIFKVRSLLKDGTLSLPTNSVSVDLFDYSAPSNLRVVQDSGGLLHLYWDLAEEMGMVGFYVLYINGAEKDMFPRTSNSLDLKVFHEINNLTSMNNYDLLSSKRYKLQLRSIRFDGSDSSFTNEVIIEPSGPLFVVDKIEPTNTNVVVTIEYPENAVLKMFRINSGNWQQYTTPITMAENGTVEARSTDAAGNQAVNTINVTNIEKIPPTVTLTASPTTPTNSNVTITINATDNVAVTQTKWASGNQSASYFVTGGTVLSGNTFAVSTNGYYTVWATDAVGNQTVQTININNIDKIPPSAPTNLRTSFIGTNATLSWTASTDNVGVTSYKVYNGSTLLGSTTSTSYVVQSITANSLYILKVTALDAAGNESQSSNMIYIYPGNYQYFYTPSGRVDYVQFSTGQKLKHTYDANGNLLNTQLHK